MTAAITALNETVSRILWGPATLLLFLAVGILYTVRCGFLQFFHPRLILKKTVGSLLDRRRKDGVSPFAAMSAALAGTMGVGNITGIAAAITLGGAGSVFWMWVSALIGMMTKYGEVLLAVRYRQKGPEGFFGGPMYYIRQGTGSKGLAVLFCIFCISASFGVGNMTQTNAIAQSAKQLWNVPTWLSGLAAALLIGLVTVGGIRRISQVTQWIIPVLSLLYLLFSAVVLFLCRERIPSAFAQILHDAFSPRCMTGAGVGMGLSRAVRYGFSRGIFSNEAGLGSAPIAHAAAETEHPAKQGLWGIFEVFADTIVVCTVTALVILTSGVGEKGYFGADMTGAAFSLILGQFGGDLVRFSLLFYAVAAALGWAFYGEQAVRYLFPQHKTAVSLYRFFFLFCCVLGAVTELELVWAIADTLNGLMALPNLAAMVLLCPEAARLTKEYLTLYKNTKKRSL